MTTSIIGPGIGGGGSEIAAVSVGVYANTAPLKTGLAEVRVVSAEAGRESAAGFGDNFSHEIEHGAHGLSRATRALHHILTAGGSLILISEAYELGHKIGEAIFGDSEESLKLIQGQVSAIGAEIEETAKKGIEAANKMRSESGRPVLETATTDAAKARIAELDEEIEKKNQDLDQAHDRIDYLRDPRNRDSIHQQGADGELERDLQFQEDKAKEINRLTKERAQLQDLVNRGLDEGGKALKEQEAATRQIRAEERRRAAERDVDISKMAADISRMTTLMEIGVRQHSPVSPGTTVIRGGR